MGDNEAGDHPQYAEAIMQLSQVNEQLEELNAISMCGPDCLKERESTQLKERWLNAEVEANSVPELKKAYIVYSEGQQAYNKMEIQQLNASFDAAMTPIAKEIRQIIEQFEKSLEVYQAVDQIGVGVTQSLSTATLSNDNLKHAARTKIDSENRFDRLAHFESKGTGFLKSLKFLLFYVCCAVGVVYVFSKFNRVYSDDGKGAGTTGKIFSPAMGKLIMTIVVLFLFLKYSFRITGFVWSLATYIAQMLGRVFGMLVLPFSQTEKVDNPLL